MTKVKLFIEFNQKSSSYLTSQKLIVLDCITRHFKNTHRKFGNFLSNNVLKLNKFIKTQNLIYQSIL